MKLYLTRLLCCSQFASACAVEPRPPDWTISICYFPSHRQLIDQNGMVEIGARRKGAPDYRDLIRSIGAKFVTVGAGGSIEFARAHRAAWVYLPGPV
jgi:hypothetical protein